MYIIAVAEIYLSPFCSLGRTTLTQTQYLRGTHFPAHLESCLSVSSLGKSDIEQYLWGVGISTCEFGRRAEISFHNIITFFPMLCYEFGQREKAFLFQCAVSYTLWFVVCIFSHVLHRSGSLYHFIQQNGMALTILQYDLCFQPVLYLRA